MQCFGSLLILYNDSFFFVANNISLRNTKKPRTRRGSDDEDDKTKGTSNPLVESLMEDERLKYLDPILIERICSEILDASAPVLWDDIGKFRILLMLQEN